MTNKILISSLCIALAAVVVVMAEDLDSKSLPVNHKSEDIKESPRNGRQYDSPMSATGTGTYASVSASDSAAYVGQTPLTSNLASAPLMAAANYVTGDLSNANYYGALDQGNYIRGYPQHPLSGNHYSAPYGGHYGGGGIGIGGGGPLGFSSSHGTSSSSMFPLMAKGFDVSEIICTAIAVAIGAVIVGAPFILIYLFIMNQMSGGNGPTLGPTGGGAISLTGPSSTSQNGGRKKRNSSARVSLVDELMQQLSPYVNSEQLTRSFKQLMDSIAKYQV